MRQKIIMEQSAKLNLCIDEKAFFLPWSLYSSNPKTKTSLLTVFRFYCFEVSERYTVVTSKCDWAYKNVATTLCKTNETNFNFSDTFCKERKAQTCFGLQKWLETFCWLILRKTGKTTHSIVLEKKQIFTSFFIKVGRTLRWDLNFAKRMNYHTLCMVQ